MIQCTNATKTQGNRQVALPMALAMYLSPPMLLEINKVVMLTVKTCCIVNIGFGYTMIITLLKK